MSTITLSQYDQPVSLNPFAKGAVKLPILNNTPYKLSLLERNIIKDTQLFKRWANVIEPHLLKQYILKNDNMVTYAQEAKTLAKRLKSVILTHLDDEDTCIRSTLCLLDLIRYHNDFGLWTESPIEGEYWLNRDLIPKEMVSIVDFTIAALNRFFGDDLGYLPKAKYMAIHEDYDVQDVLDKHHYHLCSYVNVRLDDKEVRIKFNDSALLLL